MKTILRVISVLAVSLILQACFGILFTEEPCIEDEPPTPSPPSQPVAQQTTIRGTVKSNSTGKPIPGINVSTENIDGIKINARTYLNGNFELLNVPIKSVYIIKFEDVDGEYNDGLFKAQTWVISHSESSKTLLVGMDLDTVDTQTGCCESEHGESEPVYE